MDEFRYHTYTKNLTDSKFPTIVNNMLVYNAVFCINSDPDNKRSKRIFISVPIEIGEKVSLHIPRAYQNESNDNISTSSSSLEGNCMCSSIRLQNRVDNVDKFLQINL